MAMSDIVDIEEALTKTGAELFKELYRIYPVADPEDYFRGGQWRDAMMKTDLLLVESHRRECGSPDVPDLEDIKVPSLPQGYAQSPLASMPAFAGFAGMKLAAGMPALVPGQASAALAPGGTAPVVEIRLIALFVAKWKLDPVLAKTALAKLTPARRRYVIQNFKTALAGAEATAELETYISKCEEDGSWDTAAVNGAANGITTVAPPQAGTFAAKLPTVSGLAGAIKTVAPNPNLKRPAAGIVQASPAWQQNKRPTLGVGLLSPSIVRPPATGGLLGAVGGAKAGMMVRPPVRPAGAGGLLGKLNAM